MQTTGQDMLQCIHAAALPHLCRMPLGHCSCICWCNSEGRYTSLAVWYLPCSILYQRGIYPPESFQVQKGYGLSIMLWCSSAYVGLLVHCKAAQQLLIHCALPAQQVQKRYGLSLMVTAEENLTKYLSDVLTQMSREGRATACGMQLCRVAIVSR